MSAQHEPNARGRQTRLIDTWSVRAPCAGRSAGGRGFPGIGSPLAVLFCPRSRSSTRGRTAAGMSERPQRPGPGLFGRRTRVLGFASAFWSEGDLGVVPLPAARSECPFVAFALVRRPRRPRKESCGPRRCTLQVGWKHKHLATSQQRRTTLSRLARSRLTLPDWVT
jgi:hypothetical protein